jgi:hypothetical protein
MNHGRPVISAYARCFWNSGEMYNSLAGAGDDPFDFTQVTSTTSAVLRSAEATGPGAADVPGC